MQLNTGAGKGLKGEWPLSTQKRLLSTKTVNTTDTSLE